MAATGDESISIVQSVCECSRERAIELLEAGGSVERAVDVYFSQQQQQQQQQHERLDASGGDVIHIPDDTAAASAVLYDSDDVDICNPASAISQSPIPTTNQTSQLPKTHTLNEDRKPPPTERFQPINKKSRIDYLQHHYDEHRLQYLRLAEAFAKMADTTKRLAKIDALQQVLRGIIDAVGGVGHGDELSRQGDGRILQYAMELILGNTLTLQVSGAAVCKAIVSVTGVSSAQLRTAYRQTGDLGDASDRFLRNQRLLIEPTPLTIVAVHEALQKIAAEEGKGSQTGRQTLIVKLLRSCKSSEIRFLVRTLLGNMRLGANIRTVLSALAMAINNDPGTKDEAIKTVQDTFDYCPRLDKVCLSLLVGGVARMAKMCTLEVGTCINPMLANPAHSLDEVAKMMSDGGPIVAEWKYDGVRCQAHYTGSKMMLYSRHKLENTEQFPDVVQFIAEARANAVHSFIIDAEIVAIERSEGGKCRLLPFQDLSTRRGTKEAKERLEVKVFAFDLMYLNGESLVKKPLHERQRLLRESFNMTLAFEFASSIAMSTFEEPALTQFLQTAVAGGAEGLMVKLTGVGKVPEQDNGIPAVGEGKVCSPYESGVRSRSWLKVKRDYVAGFADTIDVVPIGAWYGNGRKAQKGFLSPVLLAVYDEEEEVFRSICRCMSFTDAMYLAMREYYFSGVPYPSGVGVNEGDDNGAMKGSSSDDEKSESQEDGVDDAAEDGDDVDPTERVNCYPTRPAALVVTGELPSIWFRPSEVFEVSFSDLTLSRQHSAAAGLVDPTRGVALRFPRFKRRRPDKRIEQATTTTQIADMFAKQAKQQGQSG